MKEIQIPFMEQLSRDADLTETARLLDNLPRVPIETQSWPEYSYMPDTGFSIAHSGDCVFVKFNVLERSIRAVHLNNNDPVSQDSCVEFFIAPDNGSRYYNFEFNCIGTCKAAFGTKVRKDRVNLGDQAINGIQRLVLIRKGIPHNGMVAWELAVNIPLEAFSFSNLRSFTGLKARANFYKCGDNLPNPHFISWNEVKSAKPDFHLPEFFGKIHFL